MSKVNFIQSILSKKTIIVKQTISLNHQSIFNYRSPFLSVVSNVNNNKLIDNGNSHNWLYNNRNYVTYTPQSIEIIKIKAKVEHIHPKYNAYKDIEVGKIIENKFAKGMGTIIRVKESSTVYDAIEHMSLHGVGAVIVVDAKGQMSGIFSERDYLAKVELKNLQPKEVLVKDIMSKKVISVLSDSGASKCLSIMSKRNIRHLPVVENNRLIGMLSIGDIVKFIVTEQNKELSSLANDIKANLK
ncbi:hypothetical protein DLAC_04763 [Tieghemostelium lacteum]|uniref:CBS domain-containing protein n=1 Tax=Tieghemostelium lacteum TaxID=361077 RepID=A0A151ZL00_TIELA|nr:hypothetical protein DLAC_04763 [Tieghemostelium lacteum]|eukprot:KYQ94464.1 hypothetical protein DLAC_04763 [Tieghemostelium lacteum]